MEGNGCSMWNCQTKRRAVSVQNKLLAILFIGAVLGVMNSLARPARGYTPSPPPSFAVPTRDGKHILVMLSPVPVFDDKGNACTLPNGEKTKLRETYRISGLYELGSATPIWTIDWYGEMRCVSISEDGQNVVRINPLWGGHGGCQEGMDWGIKFYDAGVQIKSYDVSELVDYPSLTGYGPRWVDWKLSGNAICDGMCYLSTLCRERYAFDVKTGRIVEESRHWRKVVHWTYAALSIIGVLSFWWVRRIRKARRIAAAMPTAAEVKPAPYDGEKKPFQYSLLSLMVLVTFSAVLCSAFTVGAHVGVFVSSVALAAILTDILWRKQRRAYLQGNAPVANRSRKWLWAAVLASWFVVYVLSMGPVAAVMSGPCLDCRSDTRVVVLDGIYAPAYSLYRLRCRPLRLYFSAFAPDTFSSEIWLRM
jgi:hypothetical protein